MNTKTIKITGLIIIAYIFMVLPVIGQDHKSHDHDSHHHESHDHEKYNHDSHHHESHDHEKHNHAAHHGGCLNALEKCELAHVEVKVKGNTMRCWFVGGGNDTDKAVRIPEKKITLNIKSNHNKDKKLTLIAKPIELAEEKIGDCSYFEGKADWLASLKEFKAYGKAKVKGKVRKIEIHYPKGYDPEHEKEEEHGHEHENEHAHGHEHEHGHKH